MRLLLIACLPLAACVSTPPAPIITNADISASYSTVCDEAKIKKVVDDNFWPAMKWPVHSLHRQQFFDFIDSSVAEMTEGMDFDHKLKCMMVESNEENAIVWQLEQQAQR